MRGGWEAVKELKICVNNGGPDSRRFLLAHAFVNFSACFDGLLLTQETLKPSVAEPGGHV